MKLGMDLETLYNLSYFKTITGSAKVDCTIKFTAKPTFHTPMFPWSYSSLIFPSGNA
jgi:hypothetical protein